jgi:hypothetical protein
MNIDFHYYATYVAARLAGYKKKEAETIAYAAQYVDDSTEELLKDAKDNYYIKDFKPIPTCQSKGELIKYNVDWSGSNLQKIQNVWIPFHFLPGNYNRSDTLMYKGPKSDKGSLTKWTFTKESENHFMLLCRPNSLLVKEMIKDLVENHQDDIHFIGLRLHVLADTWAHEYYAGIPAWYMNNAGEVVTEIEQTGNRTQVKWRRIWPLMDLFNPNEATPDMPYYNSIAYLGHGRMGHLPDFPYIKYEYQPQWSDIPIIKDNRSRFLEAFRQLVYAMQCIRNRREFQIGGYAELDSKIQEIVKGVLFTRNSNQSKEWKANIPNIIINGKSLELPKEYDPEAWLDAFKKSGDDDSRTDYYRFNSAAVQHFELVKNHLEKNGQFIMEGDMGSNTIKSRIKNKDNNYISNMSESNYFGVTSQYYAKMGKNAIPHKIIKIDKSPLRSGAIVQIETTQRETGEYSYLGAWTTKALYYYKKDQDLEKQRWKIEKVDLSSDDIIRNGDRIRIRNLYYATKSYMASYRYLLEGEDYLTTQENEAEWILEII